MEIVDNRALKLTVRNPDRITQVIPKSKVIEHRDDGLHEVLVHWGHDETRVLKNLGIKNVPSPILGKYNWPGLYKPFEHQRATAAFLTMHQRAFCLNEQGCGKSASVAWAADYLMERKVIHKALIICPLSIMNTAWLADIFRVSMHRTADVCHGLKDKRKQIIARDAEFLIINFDGVKTVLPELMKAKFDLIVIDEANCIKNATSDRWKAINSLVGQDTWVWALTGSPASQSPTDAYGLAKMVSPHNVPRLYSMFRDQVQYKITTFRYANKPDAMSTVHKVLQPAIRFTKQECLDLPELVYATREVPLTTQQAKYYKQLKEHMRIQAAGEDITAPNAAVNLNKLLQCSAGSVYSDTKEVIEFDVSTRLHELDSIIEECQHKILLFATFRHSIDLLQRHITNLGISTEVIHGGISANKRTEVITSFQTKDSPRILIIQPQSAAHGVTLTKADTIVWWSLPTSYEIYTQANARIHRPGQVNHCTVIHLIGSPVEKKLLHAIEKREESQISLLDMFKDELMS